ncbi:hypothetical protein [Streptomyces sp. KMM 9044]|uniref:hypothetical protein n=1 Tax=Streptomyces sp. KMM 9044 TaxID=2744474 RepID=UPI00215078D3|nr:hypothetical protein [Streptomyces sp. KMM 9044]WAX76322.1 hypothetical protein HUV60_000025 [Streptomyces sp. KMM 9044]WAX79082.1 hypothetical protein HUV60_016795 [Streptomyces sp. KMM 9044]
MKKSSSRILAIAALTTGAALASAAPAQAGIIDGTLNNVSALASGNPLGALLNGALPDESNNNANTKTSGKENNSTN